MFEEIIKTIIVTLLPFLELRASIPYGILVAKMDWTIVFIIAITVNIILGMIIYLFLDKLVHYFFKIKWFKKLYDRYVLKIQKKVQKKVDRYGELGLAIFIGIPLPGSGVYSGALAAYILGLKYRKFLIANVIGVLIAGIIVTLIVVSGTGAFELFLKKSFI